MDKCAIIIDNRPSKELDKIIDAHMEHLKGWDLAIVNNIPIYSAHDYNVLLTSAYFWEGLNYDKVLIFQHDSMMLKPIPDYMLKYNYVGAPWKASAPWSTPDRRGGNGGISIRDVKAHIKLCREQRYNPSQYNEDVWFSHNLPNVAPYEVCKEFGVETEFMLGTCTYHAIDKHLTPEQCKHIIEQYG